MGILVFKILGGRFWAIAPSSYTHLGSFARVRVGSIPATDRYATSVQRSTIESIGKKYGCHTCGTRMRKFILAPLLQSSKSKISSEMISTARFVSDHMPPKSVAEQINSRWYNRIFGIKVNYRFFPQCITCSSTQGSILSKATQELRKYHFSSVLLKKGSMIPNLSQAGGGTNAYIHGLRPRWNHFTGGILASIAVVGNSNNKNGVIPNHDRYELWQRQCHNWSSRTFHNMYQTISSSLPKPRK
jgi:hypothetical protein